MQWINPGEIEILAPLLIATLAGSLIGIERELRHKAAGVSTNMLICSGACLFTLISARVDPLSTSRIAANILQGVGFIGAGLILKESTTNTIRGLTSAAGIWMAAAIGMSFGYGFYLLAAVGTVIAIFTPRLPRWFYNERAKKIVESTIQNVSPPSKGDTKPEIKQEKKDEKK